MHVQGYQASFLGVPGSHEKVEKHEIMYVTRPRPIRALTGRLEHQFTEH